MRRAVAAFVSPLESSPQAVLRRAVAGLLFVYAGALLTERTVAGKGVSPVALLMMAVCVAIWQEWGGRSVRDWGLVLVCFLGYAAGANALPDIGVGDMGKPYQKPYPPVMIPAMSPNSSSARLAARRGWDLISANFVPDPVVKGHWKDYADECAKLGRKPDGDLFPWEKTDLVEDLKAALAEIASVPA